MPGAVVPNQAEKDILASLFAGGNAPQLKLFMNDYTPAAGSTLADLTEANFGGYAARGLSRADAPATNPAGQAEYDWAQQQFTATGFGLPQTIYGWYITFVVGGATKLLMAKRFDTAVTLTAAGQSVLMDLAVLATEVQP